MNAAITGRTRAIARFRVGPHTSPPHNQSDKLGEGEKARVHSQEVSDAR